MGEPGEVHPVSLLLQQLRHFGSYPEGVLHIDERRRVRGTAFFPAGNGLWDPDGSIPPLSDHPLMLLGHNFGDTDALEDAFKRGMEDMKGPTWRNLLRILADAQVSPARCFFTNALIGLKNDGKGCVGSLSLDPEYRRKCTDFLRLQIETIRPGCLLALGSDAMEEIIRLSPDVRAAWCGPYGGWRSIKSILARSDRNPIESVRFSASLSCGVAVMYHPCELRNLRPVWNESVAVVRAAASLCES